MTKDPDKSADLVLTWKQVQEDTWKLARQLQGKGAWDGILTLARGGMTPACILAWALGIRRIRTISVASYDDREAGQITPHDTLPEDMGDGTGWLVVDDLTDTGQSFAWLRDMYPKAHYACVYAKPQGAPLANSYAVEVPQDRWIDLPWEKELPEAG